MFEFMNERKLGDCPHHGKQVVFLKHGTRWRCSKCLSEAVQRRRDKIKQLAIEYKGSKCEICGYNKCIAALEFHHKDPAEKDFGISAKGYTRSWEAVKIELDKCILVCANCHRELHSSLIQKPLQVNLKKPIKEKKKQRLSKCPSKEVLEKLITEFSNCKIAEQFQVSETSVRKWRKKYTI